MAVAARKAFDGFVGRVCFGVWQVDAVLIGQFKDQLRRQAAFQMYMVLAFGKAVKELV